MEHRTITTSLIAGLLAVLLALASCTTPEPTPTSSSISAAQSSAVAYFVSALEQQDRTLYVYKDFADGLNNFTQKAWIGDSNNDVPGMNEAAAGLSGSSGVSAVLDLSTHSWGGYMFLNGCLPDGTTEPVPDFGEHDCGHDLTGATRLVFYAKGETGQERVEFFMGGLGRDMDDLGAHYADSTRNVTLGTVQLKQTWTQYAINLSGVDLTRIGNGFGWVANDRDNSGLTEVRFSVDDIRYEFSDARLSPMFLQSYASAEPGTDEAIINNFAYLYDNAAAAIALTYAGYHSRAQQIADAIVYSLNNDRYYSDGRLRNAYSAGNPDSFPGWQSGARLPGFYDLITMAWQEDYYAVSTDTGNLAWAIMALCIVYQQAPEHSDYLDAATRIGDFVLTLKDALGGFTGGYGGWEPNPTVHTYKATEHNIDLITAYGWLAQLTGNSEYADAAEWAKNFVLGMYDPDLHLFYTGVSSDGVTINKDVLPLDANTWAILALGDQFPHGVAVMEAVEEHMGVASGFDFNEDKDGVWFEGTAQAALAYRQLGHTTRYAELLAYLNANQVSDGSLPAADRDGVTTGLDVAGTDIPWLYNNRSHVGATAWLSFAQLARNPFDIAI